MNRHILLKIHIGRGPVPLRAMPLKMCLYPSSKLYDQEGVQAKVWEYLTLANRFLPCFSRPHSLIVHL